MSRTGMRSWALRLSIALAILGVAPAAWADESAEELAQKLANPISSLVSLPLQLNYDQDFGG